MFKKLILFSALLIAPLSVRATTWKGVAASTTGASQPGMSGYAMNVDSGTINTFTSTATAVSKSFTMPTTSTFSALSSSVTIGSVGGSGTMNGSYTFSSATFTTLAVTTITPTNIVGTTGATNAPTGDFGEQISSVAASTVLTSTVWSNLVSITLTAGDWDVSGQCEDIYNGNTANSWLCAVSKNSGSTTSDHVDGDNLLSGIPSTATSLQSSVTIASYRLSLSGTTTVYLKINESGGSLNNGKGRLSARRAR